MNTKIICTIGPKTGQSKESYPIMEALAKAGMNVARINCSHASVENINQTTANARMASKKTKKEVLVMLDTKGPDVRLGTFGEPFVTVEAGQKFTFYFGDKYKNHVGTKDGVYVQYDKFPSIIKVGADIRLNDGRLAMTVTKIKPDMVEAKVVEGGILKDKKALAAPGYDLQLPFISPEDVIDFEAGVKAGVDWIAASAVMRESDITELRALLQKLGAPHIKIISKIEDRLGLSNLDAIIAASDGIMVARGGLGTDIGLDKLPAVQKDMIKRTRAAGKIIVTATEMMESMMDKPNPTRAEASDVANAVWDGTDFIMFSGETAAGKYPVETVEWASRIATEAEKSKDLYRV
ncbi:MAG: pyruvate kinase [Firmicutes bacterium]|nr:pyruvate kinase [Bacillota bacterium]